MANVKKLNRNAGKLIDHFNASEFACKDGTSTLLLDYDLLPIIERFRQYVGRSVIINSAYRTDSYNRKVGGASQSYHKYGRALDIHFTPSYNNCNTLDKMCAFFNTLGLKGIIKYSTFVHIDTRISTYHRTSSGKAMNYGKVNIPYGGALLRKGSKGVDVGILQFKLTKLGYNCGNADMIFGNNTKNAVMKYQRANNLVVDGIVGKNTWNKLFN